MAQSVNAHGRDGEEGSVGWASLVLVLVLAIVGLVLLLDDDGSDVCDTDRGFGPPIAPCDPDAG